MPKPSVFISHASKDDAFVQDLREALEFSDVKVWADSRELAAGDKLSAAIEQAIARADTFLVVASNHSIQSKWVIKEVRYALTQEAARGAKDFKIIPILLDGFSRDGLNNWFEEERIDVAVSSAPGELGNALPRLLKALGLRLPTDTVPTPQPPEPPVNELLLALENPAMYTEGGLRRGMARAKLEFHPADGGDAMESESFEFVSPLGPIEGDRLKWYIEEFPRYPFLERILDRARAVETQIPVWGAALLTGLTPTPRTQNVLETWLESPGERRFSVKMDVAALRQSTANAGASETPDTTHRAALEASGILLSTPWEILHDGKRFLFQGQNPVRVRRRLPFGEQRAAMPLQNVLRILLVVPRPDDKTAGYIDHRLATSALLDAVDALGDLAELTILETPTFLGLSKKIQAATAAGRPYSVVHFDGHGVFDRNKGLGALCFESPETEEQAKLEGRATHIVDAAELAAELNKLRIPLFFLDACQSAMTDQDPTASVAATLLENGVAAVAAMSYSVLVTTAGRFAAAFYQRLAEGSLIGSAMLAGQQALHEDAVRADLPNGEKLRLHDWFVPVLFQEKKDPQLVRKILARAAQELDKKAYEKRLGDTPPAPKHGFVGRDRELLRLERQILRKDQRWAVLRGQGGAGKTTLAAEFARWMLRTRRFGRLAFVSFEFLTNARVAIDSLGKQLIDKDFSVATFENEEKALLEIDRALRDYPTLIVLDNLESIFEVAPNAVPENSDIRGTAFLDTITAFFRRLLDSSEHTRLLLTTRERMPAPFDRGDCETHLGALAPEHALALIAHVMRTEGIPVPSMNSEDLDKQFGTLARTANYHARALTLLTKIIAERGGEMPALNADLSHLMAEQEEKYPGNRENSLFASLELSLRRLPEGIRAVVDGLAVFHGGADLFVWSAVTKREQEDIGQVALSLIRVGLAELVFEKFPYYFRIDPALPAYLSERIDPATLQTYRERWTGGMVEMTGFLYGQRSQDAQLSSTLSLLAESNLLALLTHLAEQAKPELLVGTAQKIEQIFSVLGRPQTVSFAQQTREKAAANIGEWGHTQYLSKSATIDRFLEEGNLQSAFQLAQQVLQQCQTSGPNAYPEAVYDTAMAHARLAKVLKNGGQPQQALPLLLEARTQFLALETTETQAGRMAWVCLSEIGDCFLDLGRYEEASKQYETSIISGEKRNDFRSVASDKTQLATARMFQKRYPEALSLYAEANNMFEQIGESGSMAVVWHQIGMVHEKSGNYAAAETAYQDSLAIAIRQKNRAGEASSVFQLGNLYSNTGRFEDAIRMCERAIEICHELGDLSHEGMVCSNLANILLGLYRYDEARDQLLRAIVCKSQFGHAAEIWITWCILHDLEIAEGNSIAAVEARYKAMNTYTAYRRDGGESQSDLYQWIAAAGQAIQVGQQQEVLPKLQAMLTPDPPPFVKALIRQLCALLQDSRDPALSNDPDLDYIDAAELGLLLEQLE